MKISFLIITIFLSQMSIGSPNLRHLRQNNCHELYALYEHVIHTPRAPVDAMDINLAQPENIFSQINLEAHEIDFIRNGKIIWIFDWD